MATIKLKAFVHKVDDIGSGFIYAHLFTELGANYIRITSADDDGAIQVYVFKNADEMLGDAENQSRLNESLIRADENLVERLDFASKRMLIDTLRVQHSHLFQEARFAC